MPGLHKQTGIDRFFSLVNLVKVDFSCGSPAVSGLEPPSLEASRRGSQAALWLLFRKRPNALLQVQSEVRGLP
jgi:hypothetical protein